MTVNQRWLLGEVTGIVTFTATAGLDGDFSDAPLWGLVLAQLLMIAIWFPLFREPK